jgi:hypothetical protein
MYILTPHRRGAGYFINNQESKREEGDVQQCAHCECVLILQKVKEDGGYCGRCQHLICGPCADRMQTFGCEPALKKIEQAFNLGEKYRQFCKLAGVGP